MALMESALQPIHREPFRLDSYDGLFEQLIEGDVFDLGGGEPPASQSDRGAPADWKGILDLSAAHRGIQSLYAPKLESQASDSSSAQENHDQAVFRVSQGIGSLASLQLDPIQNPTRPQQSAQKSRQTKPKSKKQDDPFWHKSRAAGVSKASPKICTSPNMPPSQQPRRQSKDKNLRDQSGVERRGQQAHQRALTAAPSVSMIQTAWPTSPSYDSYSRHPSDATDRNLQQNTATSPSPGQYEHGAYSPLSSAYAEHSGGEDMPGYIHTPATPYFTEADAMAPHELGGYSSAMAAGGRDFRVESHESHGYGAGLSGVAGGYSSGHGQQQQQPVDSTGGQQWWLPSTTAQPYGPNPAYAAASQHPGPHAIPGSSGQSAFAADSHSWQLKRELGSPQHNFGSSARSQVQAYPHDTAIRDDLGRRASRHDDLTDAHRRSSTPAMISQRKASSASAAAPRTGGVLGSSAATIAADSLHHHQHHRSRTTGPARSRDQAQPDFVNYTAEDSHKILGGVAPSGSSKTKARREKEAAEKQRKLNLAAARAVIEAGGDLEALEREGFTIENLEQSRSRSSSSGGGGGRGTS